MADTPIERLRTELAGRYTMDREIGRGGMATVYRARDLVNDRDVAIKMLLPDLAASLGADRFLREIDLGATLKHPNIIEVLDSGAVDGVPYYVMPFIDGESLRDRLDREKQLGIDEVLAITRQAAEALTFAHERDVVHRDIKPENILLTGDRVVVADFGIARAVTVAGGEKLTRTGMAVGTPIYMSPEQATGAHDVSGRSDVYSLGCVLYEMLVGQPPFTGPTAQSIMARHSLDQVPSVRIVRSAIPEQIDAAVHCALEKVPADRFATPNEFAAALATPGWRPRNGTRAATGATPPRRKLWRLAAGVGVTVAAIAGFYAWPAEPGRAATVDSGGADANRIAVLYFRNLGGRDSLDYLAAGLTEDLIDELGQVRLLDVISPNGVAPFRGATIPPDSIGRALQVGTLVDGTIEAVGDRVRVNVRLLDGASGAEFNRVAFERPATDLLGIRDSLTGQVAWFLRERLGDEVKLQHQRGGARNAEAWALVQRAELARRTADSLARVSDTAGLAAREALIARTYAAADSTLARARLADSTWAVPLVLRGNLAYEQSRLGSPDPQRAEPLIERGLGFVEAALAIDGRNADALELRGNLRYWSWLLGLAVDPVAARALIASAQKDLETAVRLSPSQAGAYGTLSHLYTQTGGRTDSKLAAQRAYEEDAYLSNADVILSRLFLASYDMGDFKDAVHWCDEGGHRFPQEPRFVDCQLWLLTSRGKDPDVQAARHLADSLVALASESSREMQELNGGMAVAAVMARAGQGDSARALARRSRGGPDIDPTRDLMIMDAFVHTLLKDPDEAFRSLKVYVAANPERRKALAEDAGWWFRDLTTDPRWRELVGEAP